MLKTGLLVFLFLGVISANAQFSNTYSEVGIMTGPVFFKSDYGQRGDFENFIKQDGFSIGGFYYLSSYENYNNLFLYLKLKLELSYSKSELQHYGKWVDPNRHSVVANQLRAMYGSTQVSSAGFQIEFYPFKTDDYYRGHYLSPFIGFGPQICYYTSKASSTLGPLGTPSTTPEKYMNAFRNTSSMVGSLTGTIGTRYKLSYYHALVGELKAQYFFSNWVDGLNPDPHKYPENKANDWLIGLNFGYIYYFN